MNNRKLNIITAIVMIIGIASCLALVFAPKGSIKSEGSNLEYTDKVFGTDMIEINIKADKDTWQNMLDNADSESYISCDVTVNGKTYSSVGVRPKGNSSLTTVSGSDSDRFSFKIQFDEYIDGQTCYGLDKLVVNNMQADYTYMKEYFSYYLMNYMGVDSPLVNYAHITVNGEEWGLYLAVECYEDSFLERTYNSNEGNLYSLKNSMGKVKGDVALDKQGEVDNADTQDTVLGRANVQGNQKGDMGGFGGSNGGSLSYTDDNSSSYSSIFGNAVFNKSGEDDFQRVITALKKLSEGEELEKYFDVDQILRYFAVHTTVVNLDSYISNMQQNYYLYENDGKLTILPWDYNLAFGGFQSGTAGSAVNFPIDTPVSGVELSERPLLAKFLEVPEYMEKYHEYLKKVSDYLSSNKFTSQVQSVDEIISDFVEKDATAFCSFDQYKSAVKTFTSFCQLRAESIMGQLNGTIPATTSGQNNSSALVDAGDINLSTMGSQGGSGEKGGMVMPGGAGGFKQLPADQNSYDGQPPAQAPDSANGVKGTGRKEFNGDVQDSARKPGAGGTGKEMADGFQKPGGDNLNSDDNKVTIPQDSQISSIFNSTGIPELGLSALVLILGIVIAAIYNRKSGRHSAKT